METIQHQVDRQSKRQEYLLKFYPLLSLIDINALLSLEEEYQRATHNKFYSVPLEAKEELMGEIAKIKGARDFILFVKNMKELSERAVHPEASDPLEDRDDL